MRIGVLCSRIRLEERLILEALRDRGVAVERLDEGGGVYDPEARAADFDVVLARCLSHWSAEYHVALLEGAGVRTVNRAEVIRVCGNKLLTTQALAAHGVPIPRTRIAFSGEAALAAAEALGYPVVAKPLVGSWGRLVARLNDRDAVEAVVEHRQYMRSPQHLVYYLQEYVDKPGRDLRVLVAGRRIVAAIARVSAHWITNTARGATVVSVPVDRALEDLVLRAAAAVGGGLLAVDLL